MKSRLDAGGTGLEQVFSFLNSFLMPPMRALANDARFDRR